MSRNNNITCYRTKRQVKAFPKFNNSIYAFGDTKNEAIATLREGSEFVTWCEDQYVKGKFSEDSLADMLGIERHEVQGHISKNKLRRIHV